MSHKKDLVNALTVDEYERCYSRASLVKMLARYGANPHVSQLNFLAGKAAAALRELEAERDRLREALRRIADGPWPPEINCPEEQTRFDERIARAALDGK